MKRRHGSVDWFEVFASMVRGLVALYIGFIVGFWRARDYGAISYYKGDLIVVPLPNGSFGVYTKEQIAAAKDRNGGAK